MILGSIQWARLEENYNLVFPEILKTYSMNVFGDDIHKMRQTRVGLGAYNPTSIPMYYRHFREEPNTPHFVKVIVIVQQIGQHESIFLPFARASLNDRPSRSFAIAFIAKHGRAKDSEAVALLLLRPDINNDTIRQVLACLRQIGGNAEIDLLRRFVIKSVVEHPKSIWALEVDPCIQAIEQRLEAEEKGLIHTPYRYTPAQWKPVESRE